MNAGWGADGASALTSTDEAVPRIPPLRVTLNGSASVHPDSRCCRSSSTRRSISSE